MEIEIGQLYTNKTWRFLVPCLRDFGDAFVTKFNSTFKLACGIHDSLFDNTPVANGRNIFIMFDRWYDTTSFDKFLEYVKTQEYYVTDYCPDVNLVKSRKLILVLKFPENYNNAYDKFLEGKYSEMFTEQEAKFFYEEKSTIEFKIVMKNPDIMSDFIKQVNTEFNTELTSRDFIGGINELEFPLKREEEIFNCNKDRRVFFDKDSDKQKLQTI